jgi:peptide chain release factor subunit 1
MCDNRFHTEILQSCLSSNEKTYGFIVVDGKGALFAKLKGNVKEILTSFGVDLPNKHGRGGQSSNRFANIRNEKRHNYIRKVAETALSCFLTDNDCSCDGLILAGSADLKIELGVSDLFDQRLKCKILKYVDVAYGGQAGLNQAIELASECLLGLKYLNEKNVISDFFKEIAKDSGLYCFGLNETLKYLEIGCVATLIVWENLDVVRYTLKKDNKEKVVHLKPPIQNHNLLDDHGMLMEIKDQCLLIDWLVDNVKSFGAKFEIITDKSQEGSQFCKGFGGIGGPKNSLFKICMIFIFIF